MQLNIFENVVYKMGAICVDLNVLILYNDVVMLHSSPKCFDSLQRRGHIIQTPSNYAPYCSKV